MTSLENRCKDCGCPPDRDDCYSLMVDIDGNVVHQNMCECHDPYPLGGAS